MFNLSITFNGGDALSFKDVEDFTVATEDDVSMIRLEVQGITTVFPLDDVASFKYEYTKE